MEFAWEKIAADGGEPPAGLTYSEKYLFSALSALYFRYKHRMISKEQGAKEKRDLVAEYEKMRGSESAFMRALERDRKISEAVWEYRKNRTLENADKIILAIDGIGIKEGAGK